jgi:hypothetical protein
MSNTKNRTNLTVGALLLAAWSICAWFFYAPTTPMSQTEIDNYMGKVQTLLETSFVMPQGTGMDPRGLAGAMSDLRDFAERDDGKAIYMVNLMKWRKGELSFPAGRDAPDGIKTAEDADLAYNQHLFWDLLANYSHTAYLSSTEPNALNYGTQPGADADGWGEIGIFRYNSRRDFFNMIASDSYLSAMYLKMVSMGAIALVPSQPHGLLFNPMPNMPVLLFFAMIIAYLVFLVFSLRSQVAGRQS